MKSNQSRITLSKPYLAVNQLRYVREVLESGKWSSSGKFSGLCEGFFNNYFSPSKSLLTHTCTDALELISLLIDIRNGDEIIIPSFTFVSTANAFLLRQAKIVWCDSKENHPNISIDQILPLITNKTKAIVVVHYAGYCVDMDPILELCKERNIVVIEDAAQAMNSYYKGRKAGTLGDLASFSFHDTKPISCGEGGLLVVNNLTYYERSRVLQEKGTDRYAFLLGLVNQYQWKDIGSSYAPSELQAACLYAQIEEMEIVFQKRKKIWNKYYEILSEHKEKFILPNKDNYTDYNNSILFLQYYSSENRDKDIKSLNEHGVSATFHYLALHKSPLGQKMYKSDCPNATYWENHILRLPIHTFVTEKDVEFICDMLLN